MHVSSQPAVINARLGRAESESVAVKSDSPNEGAADHAHARAASPPRKRGRFEGMPVPQDLQIPPPSARPEAVAAKYWSRREELFSKFNEGVQLDAESWHSVTPETIARHVAQRMAGGLHGFHGMASPGHLLIDAFCGVGGNAIQMALSNRGGVVIAIDIDPLKVEMARHNASIYGAADRIQFVVGDFVALAPRLQAHAIHLSPPWGGPTYNQSTRLELTAIQTYGQSCDGVQLFSLAARIAPSIAYYLPRNTCLSQLHSLSQHPPGYCCEIQEIMKRRGRVKWVHVLAAFFDCESEAGGMNKALGMQTKRVFGLCK